MLIVGFVGKLKRTKLLRSANWHSANLHAEKVGRQALGELACSRSRDSDRLGMTLALGVISLRTFLFAVFHSALMF